MKHSEYDGLRVAPDNIEHIDRGQIFVFGSNLSGRHGKGAAKTALKWGAKLGKANGIQGSTYGIPTKSKDVRITLPIEEIRKFVDEFIEFAIENKHLTFLVTEIGCGLAGLRPKDVAPLFTKAIDVRNVFLPRRFWGELAMIRDDIHEKITI